MSFLEGVLETLHNRVVRDFLVVAITKSSHVSTVWKFQIPIKFSMEGSLCNNGPRAQPYFNMIEMLLKVDKDNCVIF
jgi:hypothetical protein